MYNHNEYLINSFIRDTNSKEKVWKGLEDLKKKGVDPLDENFKGVSLYSLNNHIFKHMMKSPNEEQKEYLKKLWEFKGGTMQSLLRYRCEDSSFGRSLLKNVDNQVKYFERVINHSTLRELNDFLKENPKFFYSSPKLDLYRHPLRKMLLCEAAGMEMSFGALRQTIADDKLKDPSKLYEFISRYKKDLTGHQWDTLITGMIMKTDHINYVHKGKPIGDIFFLINQLNEPKELSVNKLMSSNLIEPDKNNVYFDTKNKNLTLEQIKIKWIESIQLLNIENILKSSSWSKARPLLDNATIINSLKDINDLLLNRFETVPDTKASRWPLFAYHQYRGLFESEVFQPIITKMIINDCSVETNQTLYNLVKGESNGHQRLEVYEFYQQYLMENPAKEQFIAKVLEQDFRSEAFKKIGIKIRIENAIPAKSEKPKLRAKI